MNLSRPKFLLSETIANLSRHGVMTAAAVGTAAMTLTVLGGFLLSAAILGGITADQLQRIEVAAYATASTTRPQSEALLKRIQAMPDVAEARLITREQAWAEARRKYSDLVLSATKDMKNPMTDEFQVRAVSAEKTIGVAERLRKLPGIEEVKEARAVMLRLVAVARALKVIGIAIALVLTLATTFIISSSIRLTVFARRREIQIMQLVGATNGFIRAPFMLEGLVQGVAGAALACGVMAYGVGSLTQFLSQRLPFVNVVSGQVPLAGLYLGLVGLGAVVGAAGSYLSLRKLLRA